jgi:hypothetical protein
MVDRARQGTPSNVRLTIRQRSARRLVSLFLGAFITMVALAVVVGIVTQSLAWGGAVVLIYGSLVIISTPILYFVGVRRKGVNRSLKG